MRVSVRVRAHYMQTPPYHSLQLLEGGLTEAVAGLFSQLTRDRTRGNVLNLHQEKFKLYIRKNFSLKCGWVLEQAAQGSDDITVPGGIPKVLGCGTWGQFAGEHGGAEH